MDMNQDLKSVGLKATAPRMKVLRLFVSEGGSHMSAEDVYKRLLSDGEEIGLATIYRVLTQFQHAGLLCRTHIESGKAIYELNQGDHHDHLVCMQCGRVEEFFDPVIEKRQAEIAQERGFKVVDHSLSLYVDCLNLACPHKERTVSV
ncbi:MAG: ferric iron uptake transcriptional regulator [Magnetococcales bacterium]|nr:ferric iron uptake transcriptional regulator [Magnetococcales bacterium]